MNLIPAASQIVISSQHPSWTDVALVAIILAFMAFMLWMGMR